MGLIYVSTESSELINALKANISSGKEASNQLNSGSQKIVSAVDGKALSGAAYTAGKGLFSDLILPTISKVTSAIDELETELQSYSSANDAISSEGTLNEDRLNEQIRTKKMQKTAVEASLAVVRAQTRTSIVAKLVNALLNTQSTLTSMSSDFEDDIRDLEKKLEKLHQFSSQTSNLFSDSLSNLKLAMQSVTILNNTIVNSDGTYELPEGIDASWFNSLQSKSQEDVEQTIALAKAMNELNLPKEAQKYYKEIMKDALKDVPIDQWDEALKELNKLLIFDDEGNILRVLPVNMGAGDGVIILKNGVNDQELTQQANKELNEQQLELLKQSLGQLATGLATALAGIGITGLDFAGTYFSGGTLALVGVTQAGAVAGTATAGVGLATVTDAVSQMGVQAGDINYSFANNYNQKFPNGLYDPSPKHTAKGKGGWGSEMDLNSEEAQKVLNDSIQNGKQRYGIKGGKVYEFQPDNAGGWHGYIIDSTELSGQKGGADVLKQWLQEGKISKAEYKKLIKGK